MNDANKPEKDITDDDDILDSDDLLDLDMPLDEPEELLEKDIEQLLGRDDMENHAESFDTMDPLNASDMASAHAESIPSVSESMPEPISQASQESPATEKTANKSAFGLAGSIMLTLGLVAILIASLATWLGLDASDKVSNLNALLPQLQQQTRALAQRQDQQNKALGSQIETLQQQISALTHVVANKTTEQWRAAIEKTSPSTQKQLQTTGQPPAAASDKIIPPAPAAQALNHPAVAKQKEHATAAPAAPAPIPSAKSLHPVKTAPKPVKALPALGQYEVRPGSVKGWVVNIYSVESRSMAKRQIRRLESKEIHAHYVRVPVKGKVWYRIRVNGFKNEHAAMVFKKFLEEYHGIDGAWYQKLK